MLHRLIASRLITPPAIWGKVPSRSDFVRSGMRHGESEGWQTWLLQQDGLAARIESSHVVAALPVAFVLPPGSLAFAPRRFVIGVITPSKDRLERLHPLLVYQLAHPRWVQWHFGAQARHSEDWLFWLARAVARHTSVPIDTDMQSLERTVRALWRLYAPDWQAALWRHRRSGDMDASQHERARVLLDQLASPLSVSDPAQSLLGVHHLPWVDWPQRLQRVDAKSAFWQQDATGGFVDAADHLQTLWGEQS